MKLYSKAHARRIARDCVTCQDNNCIRMFANHKRQLPYWETQFRLIGDYNCKIWDTLEICWLITSSNYRLFMDPALIPGTPSWNLTEKLLFFFFVCLFVCFTKHWTPREKPATSLTRNQYYIILNNDPVKMIAHLYCICVNCSLLFCFMDLCNVLACVLKWYIKLSQVFWLLLLLLSFIHESRRTWIYHCSKNGTLPD